MSGGFVETLGVVFSVVASTIAATWVLRSKLCDIERALSDHASSDASNFKELGAKIIKLETRAKRR